MFFSLLTAKLLLILIKQLAGKNCLLIILSSVIRNSLFVVLTLTNLHICNVIRYANGFAERA